MSLGLSAPSMRLAYKDLEQQRKIEEQKLKGLEGKKKEQAERLGMGLGARRYDDDEANSKEVPMSASVTCPTATLQRRVSLGGIRHAHHPSGESSWGQDQRTAVH